MRRSWSRMVSRLFRKPLAKPVVRRVPSLRIESLEDRVVPATVITILDNGVGTLDGFLSATDGTITPADDAGIAGTLSRAALQGVNPGVNISITAETQIVFGDLSAPLLLQTGAGNSARFEAQITSITFTDGSDSLQTAGGDLDLFGRTLVDVGSLASGGGDIMLVGDDLELRASIDAGLGAVQLQAFNALRNIDLGSETVGATSLTAAELGNITAGVLRIGTTNTGDIGITDGLVFTTVPTLRLTTGGEIFDLFSGTDITVQNLALVAGDGIGVGDAVNIEVENLAFSNAFGDVVINQDSGNLTIAAVDGLLASNNDGLTTDIVVDNIGTLTIATDVVAAGDLRLRSAGAGQPLTLNAGVTVSTADANIELAGGGIVLHGSVDAGSATITLEAYSDGATQTAGTLTAIFLELLGAGDFTLNNPANDVADLAANLTSAGTLTYVDADPLNLGLAGGTSGITTIDGAVNISTVQGDLRVTHFVNAGAATVVLAAGSTGAADSEILISGAGVTGTGGITLSADNMSITAAVTGGTSAVRLDTFDATTAIDLGGADGAATLGLTDAELDLVTAGTFIIGDTANTGGISITDVVSPANATLLLLETGGSILNGAGGKIIETNVGLTAATGIGSAGAQVQLQATNVEAETQTGGIAIQHTGSVNIGGVTGTLNGVRVLQDGPIEFIGDGNIFINRSGETVAGPGAITITATGAASDVLTGGNNASTVVSFGSVESIGGLVSITAGRDVLIGDAGTLEFGDVAGVGVSLSARRHVAIDVNSFVLATGAGDITIEAGTAGGVGNVSVLRSGGTAGATIFTTGGDVTITGGADSLVLLDSDTNLGVGPQTIDTTQNGGNGNVTINADRFELTADDRIRAGAGIVTIQQVSADWDIDLGASTDNTANTLEISNNEIDDRVFASVLRIGDSANTGDVIITDSITLNEANTLHIRTGGAIVDGNGAGVDITVPNLALSAANGIGSLDPLDVSVTNLAAANSTAGNIEVANTGALTLPIGGVDGVIGVSNTGADIFLSATNGAITVDAPIAATGGGSIGLTTFGANGAIATTANGSIRTTGGSGDIHLNASNAGGGSITIENGPILQDVFAAGLGKITLDASTSVLVAAGVTIQSGVVSAGTGGTITIRSNVGQANGTEDISLLGGAQFTRVETNGDIVIDADPDGNCVGGTLITTATTSLKSPDGTTGAANIDINVATDIVLRFALAVGDITVHSCQNILDDGDDSTVYGAGNNIVLDAFGIMGGATPITTADVLSASTATPTVNYRGALDLAWGGTLTLDQTGSLGNIQIRKVGAPLVISTVDGVNGVADIVGSGNQFVLIGTAGVEVDEVFTLSGAVNADFFIASVGGNDVSFTGPGSAINNGANTTTTVIASGNTSASITGPAANDTANITGFNVLLATSGGNIGAAGSPIEINSNAAGRFDGFTTGAVNGVASPGGDAFVTDTQNGIRVGLFNAGTGEVELNSLGNITPTGSSIVAVTHNDNVAEIVADIVSLNASGTSTGTGGQIGLPGTFFEVNANVLNASTSNSNLWISEVGAGAAAGTTLGLVTLGTTTGNTTAFLRVRNGGTITSETGDIGVADVVAPVVNLSNVAGDTPTGGGFGAGIGNAVEIDAATLDANLPNGGTLFIDDTSGGLTVQRANTTNGSVGIESSGVDVDLILGNASSTGSVVTATAAVTLQSGFGILSSAPAGVLDVTGASLAVTADSNFGSSGTPIQTAVSKVGGTVAGGFFLENTTGLDLDTVLANLDVTITTVDAAGAGQDIDLLTGEVVSSFAGNVALQAGDNISIPTGATVEAPMGTVSLSGDFNDADAGVGATIDITGAVISGNAATVTGGPDSDSIFIAVGANDTAFDVNGNAPVFPTFPGDTLELDLTGVTNPVLTPTGTGAGTYDFGNKPSVTFTSIEDLEPGQTISGTIFLDANRNGVRDANELPVAGNTVHLDRDNDGTDDEFTFTDANGFYSFPDQTPGTYSIRFDSDPNFVLTTPNPVVIGPLDTTTGLDFGTFGRSLEVIAGPTLGSVIFRDAENGTVFQTIVPFVGFIGTVTTAVADVNGDGYLDAITGAGPGGGPHVKVFSGRDFTKIVDFFAYDDSFRGGVYVAAGDLNGDGRPEIITGAGQDGGPHVKVFIGGNFLGQAAVEVASFFAYDPSVRSGVHVGAADVNGDGVADIITGAREGFAPHVKVFDPVAQTEIRSFFAYDASFTGGVFVAGGDLDGDGFAEIITGSSTLTSHVKAFSGQNGSLVQSFFAFATNVPGVAVGVSDKDNDGTFDILAGSRNGSHVRVFDGATLAELDSFLAFAADLNGVFVGGA